MINRIRKYLTKKKPTPAVPVATVRKEVAELEFFLKRVPTLIYLGRLYENNWRPEFAWQETDRYLQKLEAETLKLTLKIQELTDKELDVLGFIPWNSENHQRLVPAYMHKKALADGVMKESDDTDTRFGCFFSFVTGSEFSQGCEYAKR